MRTLQALVGRDHDLAEVPRELRAAVRALGASGVGGFHITCSDESEHECSRAFQCGFAEELLPRLRFGDRVPFRIANPGARYDWGSVRYAEQHFATPQARGGFLAMVVKINGHVALTRTAAQGQAFGQLERYGEDSLYCGAVAGLLEGSRLPFVRELDQDLAAGSDERLAALRAAQEDGQGRGMLFGALACARQQARKCVIDIQDHLAAAPTFWIVLHGVTLNRAGQDRELLGGIYLLDHRGAQRRERYRGLGADPAVYRLSSAAGGLVVEDPGSARERPVRDHRVLAARRLGRLGAAARRLGASSRQLLQQLHAQRATPDGGTRALLKLLLAAVSVSAPLAGALLLAAEGAADVHQLWRLEHTPDGAEQERIAREVLDAVHARMDTLPPQVTERVGQALLRELGGAAAGPR